MGVWVMGSKDLCEPYATVLKRLLEEALRKLGDRLVSLVVFGSIARCEARTDSDIDLLVIIRDPPKGRFRRQEIFMEIEEGVESEVENLRLRGYNVEFSPIIKSVEEALRFSPIYLDMVEDAVVLFDRDGFFGDVLEKVRKRLRELGAERVRVGKKWYWRLKRDYRFGEVLEI